MRLSARFRSAAPVCCALTTAITVATIAASSTTASADDFGPTLAAPLTTVVATAAPPSSAHVAGSRWRIRPGTAGSIAGYADRTDIAPGDPMRLFVTTTGRSFVVRAFRMGWYDGEEARQVWRSHPVRGVIQPAPTMRPAATRTVTTDWAPSLTVPTRGWEPGDYLLRLDTADGGQSFVPLTVRGPTAAGKVVIVSPVTTWQAYNTYGCCDLYQGGDGNFNDRSLAVSFDRPYAMEHGAGEFLRGELGVVAEAERLQLPLDYVTDVDLQTMPGLLAGARAVVSVGHDEYWSPAMRAAVTDARDAGTNLAFLGANAIFRRIRFAATPLGPDRLEINYKVAAEDPLDGIHDAAVTADWPAAPDPRPESSLLGDQYACLPATPHEDGVVADPVPWLFAGTHLHRGDILPGLIGTETDAVQLAYPTPRPIDVVLHSPTDCPGNDPAYADTTYYVAASGAAVFDAGTIAWSYATGPRYAAPITVRTHRAVRRITDNVLRAFARGPAGRAHPAHDDLRRLGIGGAPSAVLR